DSSHGPNVSAVCESLTRGRLEQSRHLLLMAKLSPAALDFEERPDIVPKGVVHLARFIWQHKSMYSHELAFRYALFLD
ncbi:hypothetical protein, partial [Mesorhizobium sp. M4B.F.Ca.ET.049.02.1.2]|uniref:hypothetical protein n=1 Tax=Mesorhizobium sp. M4B.F.Ca.ET.049.02.1.2 TaxID=2496752 RepID=UPI001AED062F